MAHVQEVAHMLHAPAPQLDTFPRSAWLALVQVLLDLMFINAQPEQLLQHVCHLSSSYIHGLHCLALHVTQQLHDALSLGLIVELRQGSSLPHRCWCVMYCAAMCTRQRRYGKG